LAILQRPDVLDELDLEQYAEQLEKTGHLKAGPMLEDIKRELKTKWWERTLPWKNLEGAELFQAVAGFHGRDIFVGECEPAYYEGDIDTKQAYVPLDCQLRARLQEDQLELEAQQLDPDKRFRYGEPLFYMMTKCTFDSRQSRDDGLDMPPRFMIDVTRRYTGGGYGEPGLQSSIEWQCGILCDSFAVTRQNADKSKQNAGRNIKQRQIQHPDFQNVTYNGARRYLEGTGQGSDFVIRPSSQGTDHLTITIQFFEDIYVNVDIEERNTSARSHCPAF
jgi:transcription elongation factor SPT6